MNDNLVFLIPFCVLELSAWSAKGSKEDKWCFWRQADRVHWHDGEDFAFCIRLL